jgi:hypothetical protein
VAQFDQLTTNAHEDADGTDISVGGQRGDALITQLDGIAFISPLFGGVLGAEDRSFLIPQTVVREFQIVSSGVGAESSMTSAGLVNIATKEGSNKYHGEAFFTSRPSTLSSADAFGHSLDNFQNTYGGSVGGPMRRDRSFFYTGFEQDFLHLPSYFQLAPQFPGSAIPTAIAQEQSQIDEHNTPLSFSTRIDQVLNERNTLNLEFIGNRLRLFNQTDGLSRTLDAPSYASSLGGQSFFTRAGLATVLNTRMVNQAGFSWISDHRQQTPNSTAPTLFVNGFGVLGGDDLGPHRYTAQAYQVVDSLSLVRGTSQFVIGGSLDVDPVDEQREANLNGRFDYNSLAAFEADEVRRFQQTFVTGDTRYHGDVRILSTYANAHLELRKNLTLTAGLLWSAQWNPQPTHPNAMITQTQRVPNDLAMWQPRAGLAWSPFRKTVVRASAGLYTATTPATFFHRTFADNGTQTVVADSDFDPQILTLTGALTGSPTAFTLPPAGLTTPEALVEGIAPNFRNPTSAQAALTVDQAVNAKITMRFGYLHADTWRLEQRLDDNLSRPSVNSAGLPIFPATRPDAAIGRLLVEHSNAHSSYNGGTVSMMTQINRRSQFTINYTLARTEDDNSDLGPYGIESALDPYHLRAERGYSNLDLRNSLNASMVYNFPLGFKANPILFAHSGAPYTALTGFDTQNDANDFNDRAVINGLESNRNQFRQPAFADTDLRIVKDFTLKGVGHHLDLFMDVFNVFGVQNRNFGAQQVSLYGNSSFPIYSAGQALFAPGSSLPGGPRTIQFTARLVAF